MVSFGNPVSSARLSPPRIEINDGQRKDLALLIQQNLEFSVYFPSKIDRYDSSELPGTQPN